MTSFPKVAFAAALANQVRSLCSTSQFGESMHHRSSLLRVRPSSADQQALVSTRAPVSKSIRLPIKLARVDLIICFSISQGSASSLGSQSSRCIITDISFGNKALVATKLPFLPLPLVLLLTISLLAPLSSWHSDLTFPISRKFTCLSDI